jgi:hypothetical protein
MDAALDFELERVLAHPLSPAPVDVLLPLAGSGNQLRPSKLWTGSTAVADRAIPGFHSGPAHPPGMLRVHPCSARCGAASPCADGRRVWAIFA